MDETPSFAYELIESPDHDDVDEMIQFIIRTEKNSPVGLTN